MIGKVLYALGSGLTAVGRMSMRTRTTRRVGAAVFARVGLGAQSKYVRHIQAVYNRRHGMSNARVWRMNSSGLYVRGGRGRISAQDAVAARREYLRARVAQGRRPWRAHMERAKLELHAIPIQGLFTSTVMAAGWAVRNPLTAFTAGSIIVTLYGMTDQILPFVYTLGEEVEDQITWDPTFGIRQANLPIPVLLPVTRLSGTRPTSTELAVTIPRWNEAVEAVRPSIPSAPEKRELTIFSVNSGYMRRMELPRHLPVVAGAPDMYYRAQRNLEEELNEFDLRALDRAASDMAEQIVGDENEEVVLSFGRRRTQVGTQDGKRIVALSLPNRAAFHPLRFFSGLAALDKDIAQILIGGGDALAVRNEITHRTENNPTLGAYLSQISDDLPELVNVLFLGARMYCRLIWRWLSESGMLTGHETTPDLIENGGGGSGRLRDSTIAVEAAVMQLGVSDSRLDGVQVLTSVYRVVRDGLVISPRPRHVPEDYVSVEGAPSHAKVLIGGVNIAAGRSGSGKTEFSKRVVTSLNSLYPNDLIVVLARSGEPVDRAVTPNGASAVYGVPVDVWEIGPAHPSVLDALQETLLSRYPDKHILLLVESASALMNTSFRSNSAGGASSEGVDPSARDGLTALSELAHERVTTLALFNLPGVRAIETHWVQLHGTSTVSFFLDNHKVIQYRDRMRNIGPTDNKSAGDDFLRGLSNPEGGGLIDGTSFNRF